LIAVQNPFHGLTPRHAWLLVWKTVQEFLNDNCTQMAAAISYYVLFSLVPIIVLALGITGLVLRDTNLQQDVVDFLQEYLPLNSQADEVLATQVERAAGFGGALGLFGLAGMLWAGSGMFAVIRRSLDRAFDLEGRRPFIRQKLVDFTMMAVLGTLFLASITATGTLRAVRAYANDLDEFGQLARDLGVMWELASFLVPGVVSLVAFFLLYWLVPSTHVRKRDALIGAIVASLMFEATKVGFAIYVENFGNYNALYGSLGGAVAFLFWVFLSANIMLVGAEVASEYPRVMGGEYDSPRTRVPTVDSLTPWHLRARRAILNTLKGLVIMRPRKDRGG